MIPNYFNFDWNTYKQLGIALGGHSLGSCVDYVMLFILTSHRNLPQYPLSAL